ncbi:MAG: RluA family pseudouridine synthase [Pyrinomonadaceae bacterium]
MSQALQFQINETTGQRLDVFLASRLGWLSRMRIANLLAQGACAVNDMAAHAGYHVRRGDLVRITLDEGAPTAMRPEAVPLEITYEDDDLLVVVKPAGMLVHPTRGVKTGTLANALAYHLNRMRIEDDNAPSAEEHLDYGGSNLPSMVRPGITHRLDRATSGLMVIAKHQRALSILSRHFHHRLVEKRYLALLHGRVVEDNCLISAPIGRDPEAQPKWGVMESGKPAETRLRVLERRDGLTLVELEPITGRTNQLRIHCAHLGHAIIGDELRSPATSTRLCLHAARLAFHHPANGDWMEFNSPLPAELATVLESNP